MGELNTTKTDDPRDVVVPQLVVDALTQHQETARRPRRVVCEGLVFPSRTGGFRDAVSIKKPLRILGSLLGYDVKLSAQVLRRTYNTLLVQEGVDRLVLRSMIGHTSEEMTGRYAGIRYDQKQDAATRLERLTRAPQELH